MLQMNGDIKAKEKCEIAPKQQRKINHSNIIGNVIPTPTHPGPDFTTELSK